MESERILFQLFVCSESDQFVKSEWFESISISFVEFALEFHPVKQTHTLWGTATNYPNEIVTKLSVAVYLWY